MNPLKELLLVFLKLGTFAFGGPAAHIAMMEKEFVQKRQWLDKDEFMDLLGFTNLIPGPNSTEMALHIGYLRAKGKGMLIAGIGFILPAVFMVLGLAYILEEYGSLPSVTAFMDGIVPVMLALIVSVLISLGKNQLKDVTNIVLFIGAFVLSYFGLHEISILLIIAALALVIKSTGQTKLFVVEPFSIGLLFWVFFKIGAVLYGSGYVLLSFIKTEFLDTYGVLTLKQIMDAITIGQITPGPVFTTATAIGYWLFGVPGGIVATIGIFLPSFIFILVLHPYFEKMRTNKFLKILLEGVKVASLALMAKVALDIGIGYGFKPLMLLFIPALVLFIKTKINPTWLILGGASIGLLSSLL
jgi:chromate transporter